MINATIEKFGHPATLIREYRHWVVLLRPAQPALGSLVLAARAEVTAFSELSPEAFAELPTVIGAIETTLSATIRYQKINYLMLMMVDPHVHFHVIPRYEGERVHDGIAVTDAGWPGAPTLGQAVTLDADQVRTLSGWLKESWPD